MKHILTDIFSILTKKEKQRFNTLILLNMIISIADILSIAFILFIIKFYTEKGFAASFSFPQKWLPGQHSLLPISIFLLLFIVKSAGGYFIYKAQYRFVYNVASGISRSNLLKYLEGTYTDYVHTDSAVHIRKISQQPIEFAHYVLAGVQQIITEIILISITVITILLYSPRLFMLLCVVLLPGVVILSYFTRRRSKAIRENIKLTNEKTLQHLKEALSAFIESNIYDKNNFFTHRYANGQKTLNAYLADLHITQGIPSRFFEVFAIFGLFILVAANKLSGSEGLINIITIGAFIAAAYKIIPGIAKIINLSGQVKTYQYTVDDLVSNRADSNLQRTHVQGNTIQSIQFNNVYFTYKKNQVLSRWNMSLKKGDMIGLSGSSGKGKTTVINLLLGFVPPDEGDIIINNKITDADERRYYWQHIVYVKQQPFLMHDSILTNIVLDEKHYDKKRLDDAVQASGLGELINKFPEGIQKLVTENGKNISGGQRQRIAIARALYKDADLIILDEPFNELDALSELALLNHFKQLSQYGKMILLITHNQRSLSYCNKIISLDE